MLDELERMERAATPGPWAESGHRIFKDNGPWMADFTHEVNAELVVAARNALPALLNLWRAVAEERTAARVMDNALTDDEYREAVVRYATATKATGTALAALEGKP